MFPNIKFEILQELRANQAFWSFDIQSDKEIPDALIIEQCLKYGSWEAIIKLFKIYSLEFIRSVWEREMARQSYFHQLNVFLASVFFEISEPEMFLKNLQASYIDELEKRELSINP